MGAFLHQPDDLTVPRIVTIASRTSKGTEFKDFTTELKLLAIAWTLMKFLIGAEILIETNHKAVCYLFTCRFLNSRLTRWRLAIQDYDFKINYIEGPRNYIADTLRRMPGRVAETNKKDHVSIAIIPARIPDIQLQKKKTYKTLRTNAKMNE